MMDNIINDNEEIDFIQFRINHELKKKFKKIVIDKDLDMAQVLNKFVIEYVEKNKELL